jgi:LruC domain-containing protein
MLLSSTLFSCNEEQTEAELDESLEFLSEVIEPPTETTCGSATTRNINTEAGINIGEVVLANDIDSLYITINTTDDWYFSEAYLFIGELRSVPVNDDLSLVLADFPIKTTHDPLVRSFQYSISLEDVDACNNIVLNLDAKKLNSGGTILEEASAWIEGSALDGVATNGFYYELCLSECVVKYPVDNVATMAFEDLYPDAGDADYNDFVTTMNAQVFYLGNKPSRIEMEFTALARGSAFDHEFRIGLPVNGNVDVKVERFSPATSTDPFETEEMTGVGGEDFFITVFPATKEILPPMDNSFHANTSQGTTFKEPSKSVITITINEGEILMPVPYDPYIIVKGRDEEVHIAELTQDIDADGDGFKDYWENEEAIYPFGIVMFTEWTWPLEMENILTVYPKFEYVNVDGVFRPRDPDWYQEPEEGSNYFKRDLFK